MMPVLNLAQRFARVYSRVGNPAGRVLVCAISGLLVKGSVYPLQAQFLGAQQGFCAAQKQDSLIFQCFGESAVHIILGFVGEIDHYVAAKDQVKAKLRRPVHQVVLAELNPASDVVSYPKTIAISHQVLFSEFLGNPWLGNTVRRL